MALNVPPIVEPGALRITQYVEEGIVTFRFDYTMTEKELRELRGGVVSAAILIRSQIVDALDRELLAMLEGFATRALQGARKTGNYP
jgi:hypothetical protein